MTTMPVLLPKLEELTGVTPDSFQGMIKRGLLQEGVHWYKAPNGRIFVDVPEFALWVKSSYTTPRGLHNRQAKAAPTKATKSSKSPSPLV